MGKCGKVRPGNLARPGRRRPALLGPSSEEPRSIPRSPALSRSLSDLSSRLSIAGYRFGESSRAERAGSASLGLHFPGSQQPPSPTALPPPILPLLRLCFRLSNIDENTRCDAGELPSSPRGSSSARALGTTMFTSLPEGKALPLVAHHRQYAYLLAYFLPYPTGTPPRFQSTWLHLVDLVLGDSPAIFPGGGPLRGAAMAVRVAFPRCDGDIRETGPVTSLGVRGAVFFSCPWAAGWTGRWTRPRDPPMAPPHPPPFLWRHAVRS